MPTISTNALLHGISPVPDFAGVIRAKNGEIVLWENVANARVWTMADGATAAVLLTTMTGGDTLTKGVGGVDSDGFDIIIITMPVTVGSVLRIWDDNGTGFIFTIMATGGSGDIRDLSFGGVVGAESFWVVKENGAGLNSGRVLYPLAGGMSWGDWPEAATAFDTNYEFPGRPVHLNPWPYATGENRHDSSSLGFYDFSGGIMNEVDFLPDMNTSTQRGIIQVADKVGAAYIFAGFDGTDLAVSTDQASVNTFAVNAFPIAVHFDPNSSKYLIAINNAGVLEVYHSTTGASWALATMGAFVTEDVYGRFYTIDDRCFLVIRTSGGADYELLESTTGTTWTSSVRTGTNMLCGVYTAQGATAGTILELDRTAGTFFYSTDRGVSFSGPSAVLVPVGVAGVANQLDETPFGAVIWGPMCPIYSQVAASLTSVAWVSEGIENYLDFTEPGFALASLTMDDAETYFIKSKADSVLGLNDPIHWDVHNHSPGGGWFKVNTGTAMQYQNTYWRLRKVSANDLGQILLLALFGYEPNIGALGLKPDGRAITILDPGVNGGYFIQNIEPRLVVANRGLQRPMFLLAAQSNWFYSRQAQNVSAGSRVESWSMSEDFLIEALSFPEIVLLAEDSGVFLSVGSFGDAAVSEDGNRWFMVYLTTDSIFSETLVGASPRTT